MEFASIVNQSSAFARCVRLDGDEVKRMLWESPRVAEP